MFERHGDMAGMCTVVKTLYKMVLLRNYTLKSGITEELNCAKWYH